MSNVIGDRIKSLRTKQGLTQDDVAKKLGINRVSFSHYESGKNIPPSDNLSLLVDILHTNADYLLGKTIDPNPGSRQIYLNSDTSGIDLMSVHETNAYYDDLEKHDLVRLYKDQIQRIVDDESIHPTDQHTIIQSLYKNIEDINNIKSFKEVPLIGSICAGDGLLAEQNIEEYIAYPYQKQKKQPDYALRVEGNSMIGAGIENGDIVYLKRAQWADYSGQIVAAIINDKEDGTLKRIRWSEGSNQIKLSPENDDFETIEVYPYQVQVCGIYMGHFKPEKNM